MSEESTAETLHDTDLEDRPVKEYFTGKVREAIDNLTPSLLLMPEQLLAEEINLTPTDYELKRCFWEAVENAKNLNQTHVVTSRIYEKVVTAAYFFNRVLNDPKRVAWIIRPIEDHRSFYEAINRVALQKLLDFVRTEKVTSKNVALVAKIAEMSANRAYGAVAQKMQIQSKNLNVEMDARQLPPSGDNLDITKKLEDARSKLLTSPKDVIDVQVES